MTHVQQFSVPFEHPCVAECVLHTVYCTSRPKLEPCHRKQRTYFDTNSGFVGTFTPLVFSTAGGMAKFASVAYKRLASVLARKQDQPYSLVIP